MKGQNEERKVRFIVSSHLYTIEEVALMCVKEMRKMNSLRGQNEGRKVSIFI